MLLKRIEKDGLVKAMYDSSNILASSYNTENKELRVIFKNGGQYKYLAVENTDYFRFETDESQGKILNSTIKKYSFEKLENLNVEKVKNEVDKLIEEEKKLRLKEYHVNITNIMVNVLSEYRELNTINERDLDLLITKINDLKKFKNGKN